MDAERAKHRKIMDLPGVVPMSADDLNHEDTEGNKLYTVACMIDQVDLYVKVLKKNGYQSQRFDYDANQYMEDQKTREKLKIDL